MATDLSLWSDEWFKKLFGQTKQEYLASQGQADAAPVVIGSSNAQPAQDGTQVQQTAPAKPAQRRYRSDNRRRIEDAGGTLTPVEEVLDRFIAPTERFTRGMVAGVPATALAVPGIAGIAQYGVPAVVDAIKSPTDKGFISDVGDNFNKAVLPPEASAKLEKLVRDKAFEFADANPHAQPADLDAFVAKYKDSDEFINQMIDAMPTAFGMVTRGQNAINRAARLGMRQDQMGPGDEAAQIIGGAFVGPTPAAARSIAARLSSSVGKNVAESLAGRIAARTAEVLTPVTLPLTPGNIALNAGVGVALNEGMSYAQGKDTLFDYNNAYDPDKLPPPEALIPATGLTAAMFLGMPAFAKRVAGQVSAAVDKSIKNVTLNAGPTLEKQSDRLSKNPQLSSITGTFDENAPVKMAAQKFGASPDLVQSLDATQSASSVVNLTQATNNVHNYGLLEGVPDITPTVQIDEAIGRLTPEKADLLNKYVYAVQRQQDGTIYAQSLTQELRNAQTDLMIARTQNNRGRINAAQARITKAQDRLNAIGNDDVDTRSSVQGLTRADVNDIVLRGDADPEIKSITDAMRKGSTGITDYAEKHGLIDSTEALERKSTRELHVPLWEAAHADKKGVSRAYALFKDRVKDTFKSVDKDTPAFLNTAPRDVSGQGAVVNNPKTSWVAYKEGISEVVRAVGENNARRSIVDELSALPGAYGNVLRKFEFKTGAGGRTTTQVSKAQFARDEIRKQITHPEDFVQVLRDGKIEMWEMSDKSLVRALNYAPKTAVPILNGTRKAFQSLTTGPVFAPWFAATNFVWDPLLAQTTKQRGRSLGLADTFARRLFMNTNAEGAVNSLLDNVSMPLGVDAYASALTAIPYQLGLRAARAVGAKIADDLASQKGVFNLIASGGPQGRAMVQGVGTSMAAAFDQSALGIMSRNMSTSLSHLNDVSKIGDDYAKAATDHAGILGSVFQGYKAMIESVHMATKTAFFASNYGRLAAKHGAGNVPEAEIKKLVQETRTLTGDMSRQSGNRFVQGLVSTIPYGNATVQGTRHLLSSAMPEFVAEGVNAAAGQQLMQVGKNQAFWPQFISGVMLPTIGALTFLGEWEGAEDFWYNKTPKWRQLTAIPIPKPEVLIEAYQTGKMPAFSPDKVNLLPIAPEFSLVLGPAIAALRSMGIIGQGASSVPSTFTDQMKDVVGQVTSFSTPPLLRGAAASMGYRLNAHDGTLQANKNIPGGGANADMMTTNSRIDKTLYDIISEIGGSAANLAMQSLNVFDISQRESGSFTKALGDALDTAGFEGKRRLPYMPSLFNAEERKYAFTPESEYVYKTKQQLDPIIGSGRQMTVERDTKGSSERQAAQGQIIAQKLRDPVLRAVSEIVSNTLTRNGPYKVAQDAYSELRRDLASLEASRYKMPDNDYNRDRNNKIATQQRLVTIQSQQLQQLETKLKQVVGRRFIQQYGVPFSYEALADAVRKDVAR